MNHLTDRNGNTWIKTYGEYKRIKLKRFRARFREVVVFM